MLKAHPDITGVISGNDEMALGAIAALKDAGKLSSVKAVSYTHLDVYKRQAQGHGQVDGLDAGRTRQPAVADDDGVRVAQFGERPGQLGVEDSPAQHQRTSRSPA